MCNAAVRLERYRLWRRIWLLRLGAWTIGVACLVLASGCASVAPVVKVGLVAPFEGRFRAIGYDVVYSARLAIREVNAAGGVGGFRVGLVALDDSGDPELAVQTAAALVEDPGVVAVAGHWLTGTTDAAAPVYEEAGLAFVPTSNGPFGMVESSLLPTEFRRAYADITPFDEEAGSYAGAAYDAINYLFAVMEQARLDVGRIDRPSVSSAIEHTVHHGITGTIYLEE